MTDRSCLEVADFDSDPPISPKKGTTTVSVSAGIHLLYLRRNSPRIGVGAKPFIGRHFDAVRPHCASTTHRIFEVCLSCPALCTKVSFTEVNSISYCYGTASRHPDAGFLADLGDKICLDWTVLRVLYGAYPVVRFLYELLEILKGLLSDSLLEIELFGKLAPELPEELVDGRICFAYGRFRPLRIRCFRWHLELQKRVRP